MIEENQNLKIQEKKKGFSFGVGWFGLGLAILIILFLSYLVGKKYSPIDMIVVLPIAVFTPLCLILGLILFLFSRIEKKTKIISILIILPFFLRIIFGFYFGVFFGADYFLSFLISPVKIHAKLIEKTAVQTKNSELCLNAGELFPIYGFIFPPEVYGRAIGFLQIDCYAKMAEIKEDFSICERVVNVEGFSILEKRENIGICYQKVFLRSKKYKDILSECRKFGRDSEKIDECIKNIAIETKTIELCKGISKEYMATECKKEIQIATSDILAPCKGFLTTKKKDECIRDIAIEKDDIDLCGLLGTSEEGIAAECYKEIIFSGRRTDAEVCKKQFPNPDGLPQRVCLFEVTVNKNDITVCDKMDYYTSTYWCYMGIALKREDPEICSKIYGLFEKYDCIDELAVKTDNLNLCQKQEANYRIEDCIAKIAVQRNDEKLCETLSDNDVKVKCNTGIAVKRGDIEMCKKITSDECITEIAIAKNDPQICDSVAGKWAQYLCYKEFGIKK